MPEVATDCDNRSRVPRSATEPPLEPRSRACLPTSGTSLIHQRAPKQCPYLTPPAATLPARADSPMLSDDEPEPPTPAHQLQNTSRKVAASLALFLDRPTSQQLHQSSLRRDDPPTPDKPPLEEVGEAKFVKRSEWRDRENTARWDKNVIGLDRRLAATASHDDSERRTIPEDRPRTRGREVDIKRTCFLLRVQRMFDPAKQLAVATPNPPKKSSRTLGPWLLPHPLPSLCHRSTLASSKRHLPVPLAVFHSYNLRINKRTWMPCPLPPFKRIHLGTRNQTRIPSLKLPSMTHPTLKIRCSPLKATPLIC
jgi:hypothetical protein